MDELPWLETIDVDEKDFINLEADRVWPKYQIAWQIRRRSGDSDFPLQQGVVERMPPADGNLDQMWTELRAEALAAAQAAIPTRPAPTQHQSLWKRFFGGKEDVDGNTP